VWALLVAAAALAVATFVVISKHRQYQGVHMAYHQAMQAKLGAEYAALDALHAEQRALQVCGGVGWRRLGSRARGSG
jgi:hypothetical protein